MASGVTPRSWENWKASYEQQGYRVLTPVYPGFEVEALNADPTPIENLTVPAVIDHLSDVIGGLERPPILMGHSAGGTFTQLMLDRGHGAVGVAINSAPTEGVPVVPLSQLKSTFSPVGSGMPASPWSATPTALSSSVNEGIRCISTERPGKASLNVGDATLKTSTLTDNRAAAEAQRNRPIPAPSAGHLSRAGRRARTH
ncbi:MAG TPA: alpha/beta fold hydrolase [Propionibacteriaceae bacterium]